MKIYSLGTIATGVLTVLLAGNRPLNHKELPELAQPGTQQAKELPKIDSSNNNKKLWEAEVELVHYLEIRADITQSILERLDNIGLLKNDVEKEKAANLSKSIKELISKLWGVKQEEAAIIAEKEIKQHIYLPSPEKIKMLRELLSKSREGYSFVEIVLNNNPGYTFPNGIPSNKHIFSQIENYEDFIDDTVKYLKQLLEGDKNNYKCRWFSDNEMLKNIDEDLGNYLKSSLRKRFQVAIERENKKRGK